ncbi:MAG: type II toxin-antitoxin system VapC family toxin [Prevotellaceae bacterium]|nr:type II toxin-antitoxin system VapC family toxin [Prevotellaceae bacterium]MCD8304958.1 type II toxin-antitoxin system VapC family toxin [Prevotellaceae bacterium]
MDARLYLDTNMLVFILNDAKNRIDRHTRDLIYDYEHILMTSAICVYELLGLLRVGKVRLERKWKSEVSLVEHIKSLGIEVKPLAEEHLRAVEKLPWFDDHKDPFDRLIVAQAIAERVTLVSSDGKFSRYVKYGLDLHENTW